MTTWHSPRPPLSRAFTRRRFLGGTAAAGAGLTLLGGAGLAWFQLPPGPARRLRWISPRGSLDAMDDYPLWVAQRLDYFHRQGVDVELLPGPQDPDEMMRALADGDADVGFPPPGALLRAVDRGLPLVSAFQVYPGQVFTLAVPPLSPVTAPGHLAGKTIAVGSTTWRDIVDPMLADAGVEPRSVRYLQGGPGWTHLLANGRADAALAWDGLRADWAARGTSLRYLDWERWSHLPSNSYAVRRADLDDPDRRGLLLRFLRAVVMGLEFARQNPRAAAQLTYRSRPQLAADLSPRRALDWMVQVARGYGAAARSGRGWGFHYGDRWQRLALASAGLGYTKPVRTEDVITNRLVAAVNDVDRQRVVDDALGFALDRDFRRIPAPLDRL